MCIIEQIGARSTSVVWKAHVENAMVFRRIEFYIRISRSTYGESNVCAPPPELEAETSYLHLRDLETKV